MCDPISLGVMGVASMASSAVGSVVSAKAATNKAAAAAQMDIAQAQASSKKYQAEANLSDFQAEVAKQNAEIAKKNAEYELEMGGEQAMYKLLQTGMTTAKQRVGYAAGAIDVNSKSVRDVASTTRMFGDLDAAMILATANRKAYGYDVESFNFLNEATLRATSASYSRDAAQTALQLGGKAASAETAAGDLAATGALLSGVGSVADKWLSFQSKGVFSGLMGSTSKT